MNIQKSESREHVVSKLAIISYNQLLRELDCSRYFIHSLVKQGRLRKRYIGDKVYFLIDDVMSLLSEERLSA